MEMNRARCAEVGSLHVRPAVMPWLLTGEYLVLDLKREEVEKFTKPLYINGFPCPYK